MSRRLIGFSARSGATILVVPLFLSSPAAAETLRGALQSAYKWNPQIAAERANLRATDENVPRAISNYRPRVTFQADAGVQTTNTVPDTAGEGTTKPYGYQFSARQQVFRGFRTRNAVNEAEANIRAGRETLRSVEQTVLLAAVTAYMNVVRDQGIVRLRENNLRFLGQNLTATQDRFKVGEVTRTDVAQSQARQARSVSDLDLARANLAASRALYQRVIGKMPGYLREPGVPTRYIPKSLAATRSLAEREAPTVVAALYLEQAARYAVDQVLGELLPSFNIDAQYSHRHNGSTVNKLTEAGSIVGTLTVPLYQGGEVSARVRQAKHLHVRRIQLIHQAKTEAREEAITAWTLYRAAQAQLKSAQSQIKANEIALTGVREEEKVGQRTLLDVLNAEQEFLDAKVALTTTQRDVVVSAYRVIAAVGRLTAQDLNLSSKIYDVEANYAEVRRKWWGITITHRDGRTQERNFYHQRGRHHPYKLGKSAVAGKASPKRTVVAKGGRKTAKPAAQITTGALPTLPTRPPAAKAKVAAVTPPSLAQPKAEPKTEPQTSSSWFSAKPVKIPEPQN